MKIEVKDLKKIYSMGDVDVHALRGVSFTVNKPEFITIVGTSGSGKSTLLHMLGALDRPSSGSVKIDDVELTEASDFDLAKIRNEKIGFVFQFFNLFPTMDAQDNVEFPLMVGNISEAESRKRSSELLDIVGLGDRKHHFPNELSGGQRQRVAIARALATDPPILLCDEATGNLDSKTSDEIIKLLRKLCTEQKKTIIIVTHDLELTNYADRILHIKDGRIDKDESRSDNKCDIEKKK